MFEYLDTIDLDQFGFPSLSLNLKNMLTLDVENSNRACSQILWSVVFGNQHIEEIDMGYGIHQIVKTDVHFFLIPFLLQMLSNDKLDSHKLGLVLQILRYMASYAHFKDIDATVEHRVYQIQALVWSGFARYLDILGSTADLKLSILEIFSEYPQYSSQLYPIFVETIETIADESHKAVAVLMMQDMYLHQDTFPDEYTSYLVKFKDIANTKQFLQTVSLCIMEIQKRDSPDWVISNVEDVYAHWAIRDGKLPKGFWKIHELKDYILT